MIKLVKEYMCGEHPSKSDIQDCVEIAAKENCVIHLIWYIHYNGWNDTYIYPFETVEAILDKLPKVYAI